MRNLKFLDKSPYNSPHGGCGGGSWVMWDGQKLPSTTVCDTYYFAYTLLDTDSQRIKKPKSPNNMSFLLCIILVIRG